MLNAIIHSDEITVWWDKEWARSDEPVYRISKNGKEIGVTKKTHFTFAGLQAETEYLIAVSEIGEICVKTSKEKKRIDVTQAPYFAVADGKTLNTTALQKALNACKADECVYFPKGTYLTGALTLHSNMEIYLEKDAVLQGSKRVEDYLPKRRYRFEGVEMLCYSSLLTLGEIDCNGGYNCENLVIRGGGCISGGGMALCDAVIAVETERLKEYLEANETYIQTCENRKTIPGRARPFLVSLQNCKNAILSNVTFQYGAAWNVHAVYSKNIVTHGCKIFSDGVWNGDGWDPDSSEDCTVFDCIFHTGDNSIAVKSGKNPEGNFINRPCKNIRIFDCRGGQSIGLGSEMSGGIENVYIWDCSFTGGESGLSVKVTKKRGGYLRNIYVKDCVFTNILARSVRFNDDGESAPSLPLVEKFFFEGIELLGYCMENNKKKPVGALIVSGLDEDKGAFREFHFKNVILHTPKEDVQRWIEFKNVCELHLESISFVSACGNT